MFWKVMELLAQVASILWLLFAMFLSYKGLYLQAIHALCWCIVTSMVTRWEA